MKRLSALLFLLILTMPVNAEERLLGAFGKYFGQLFDPVHAISANKQKGGATHYQFKPTKPYDSFSHYFVTVTPKTKKVASIHAMGNTSTHESCRETMRSLLMILSEKYYPEEEHGRRHRSIVQGEREINLKCSTKLEKKPTIEIAYTDKVLEEQLIAEKSQPIQLDPNTQGL